MNKLDLYPGKTKEEIRKFTYYVTHKGLFELRQTRFIDHVDHPHDVCAIAHNLDELKDMYAKYLDLPVIWPEQ